jgi:hypothetical protein
MSTGVIDETRTPGDDRIWRPRPLHLLFPGIPLSRAEITAARRNKILDEI